MLIIYTLSYSIIINGLDQSLLKLKSTFVDFIAINNIRLWFAGKMAQLSTFDILMSLNGSIFSLSVLTSLKSVFLAKRNDDDYLVITRCYFALDDFVGARKILQKISKKNKDNIARYNAIVNLAVNKIEQAISEQSKALVFFKESKYFLDSVFLSLLQVCNSHKINKHNVKNLIKKAVSQEMHPLIFMMCVEVFEEFGGKGFTLKLLNESKIYSSLAENDNNYVFIKQFLMVNENKFEDDETKQKAFASVINLTFKLNESQPLDQNFKYLMLIVLLIAGKAKNYPLIKEKLIGEIGEVVTKISSNLPNMDKSELSYTAIVSEFLKNMITYDQHEELNILIQNLEFEIEELLNLDKYEQLRIELKSYKKYGENLSKSSY